MESSIMQELIGALENHYKIEDNGLISEAVEMQVCKRRKQFLPKGQSRFYLMLNRLKGIEFIEDTQGGGNKPYISGLYPTQKKNHFEFSVGGSEFELVLKSQGEAEVRRAGSILQFVGGAE